MNFQRVGSRRAVEIFACVLLTATAGQLLAQTNQFAAALTLSAEPPEKARPWSADLNQILLLPTSGEINAGALLSDPLGARAGAVSTNQTAAVLNDPWYSINEERMDTLMRRIEEGGYGISTYERDRSALSRAFERGVNTVFMPEPIKLGHACLGFSPYTAIKRKNPFCLLNPIPLVLSW
jgi:hypothetical protein